MEVERLEGKLVDVAEIKKLWATVAITVMQNMLRLPDKLAPQLRMMDNVERISALIDAELRMVLDALSETPLPDEVVIVEEEEEED